MSRVASEANALARQQAQTMRAETKSPSPHGTDSPFSSLLDGNRPEEQNPAPKAKQPEPAGRLRKTASAKTAAKSAPKAKDAPERKTDTEKAATKPDQDKTTASDETAKTADETDSTKVTADADASVAVTQPADATASADAAIPVPVPPIPVPVVTTEKTDVAAGATPALEADVAAKTMIPEVAAKDKAATPPQIAALEADVKISKAETKQVPAKTAETEDADDSKFDADGKTPNVKAQTEQLDQLKASDGHRNNGEVETEAPQSLHLAFKKISGEADIQRDKATTPATNAVATTTPDAAQAVSTQQTGAISHTAAVTANSVPAYTNAGAAIPVSGLAFEIAAQAREGKSRFEIRLDPPELGRINVRLNVDNDGNVTSHLIVDRADTLDLLRRDASNLERALQDSGLKTSGNALEFSLRDQSMPQRQQSDLSAATTQTTPTEDTVPVQALRRGYGRMLGLGSGLDIQV